MAHPTLVVVHGAWHNTAHLGPLRAYLEQHGYKIVAPTLPSVIQKEGDPIPASLDEDIEAVRSAVTRELESNNVVIVVHSYAGVPAMSALDGLDKDSRSKAGQSTYVAGIAAIAAFILPPGMSLVDACGGPAPIHDVRGELCHIADPPGPKHWFYEDLPAEEAAKWIAMLRPNSWAVKNSKARSAAHEVIPTTYLACKRDNAFLFQAQKDTVAASSAHGLPITLEEIDSSHSPYLSRVEETGLFIRRSAGEKV